MKLAPLYADFAGFFTSDSKEKVAQNLFIGHLDQCISAHAPAVHFIEEI